MDERIEILRIIAAKSQYAGGKAADAIQAIGADSPIVQKRLNIVASEALHDQFAEFTPEERQQIASLLGDEDPSRSKDATLQVRLTADEKQELQLLADKSRLSLSEYVRMRLGL